MKKSERTSNSKFRAAPWTEPAFTVTDAARYLQLNSATVRSWFFGESRHGRQTFRPVLALADREHSYLSFQNLVEVYVLSALRRTHSVKLAAIRQAVGYLERRWKTDHPLATGQVLTDGVDVFIEEYGRLISASTAGQTAMRAVLGQYLKRIECKDGLAIRLFPLTRPADEQLGHSEPAPLAISIDPRKAFGRPCIAGTGIPASVVAARFTAGEGIDALASDYQRGTQDIEEAIRFDRLTRAA